MKRILPLVLATAFLPVCVPGTAHAASPESEPIRVLDAMKDGPADKVVKKYLIEELRKHLVERRKTIKAITTPAQFEARQEYVRDTLNRINGPFPERTPLNARVVGTVERKGYVIEKVIYESRPGVLVTGNLYLPEGASKENRVPGVIIPCGHSANGKAQDVYQSAAISIALNGIAVLIYDPIGQGERVQLLGTDGKPVAGSTTEHTLVGVGGWLVGTGTANYRIWDGIRSLDYLVSRPEVDPTRLGCTGNSGGGTLTSYLMAFDDRIVAAAPSCYITSFERLFDTIGPQDAEQNFPSQVALGLDHADFIAARAPKPTLICVGTQDFFDIDGAWTTFREAKGLYGLLGHPERMDLIEYNDKHGFSKPRRQAAMRFMRRWLLNKDDNPEEPEHMISKDAELQCTTSGQVLNEKGDIVSIFQVTQERARQLAAKRKQSSKGEPAPLAEISRLVAHSEKIDAPTADRRGTMPVTKESGRGWTGEIESLVLNRGDGVPLPALLFRGSSDKGGKRPAVVLVSSEGKDSESGEKGHMARLIGEGRFVLSIDVRGFGETSPNAGKARKADDWFGGDIQLPQLAMHLNRPLVGQRADDIIAAVSWLSGRDDVDAEHIEVVGIAHAGPAALHAGAFDKRIAKVTLIRSIRSWEDVVETPLAKNQLQNVVPFALETYDLPDLVRLIAPRPVTILEPVDPEGRPIDESSR
ncbi:MAG: acetylxylan esterase [Planctomycetaceae bacterium]|nr:acetylxylan esterase [Planctomycetaceae bacterium]